MSDWDQYNIDELFTALNAVAHAITAAKYPPFNPQTDRCKHCRYFEVLADNLGTCRRRAPIPGKSNEIITTAEGFVVPFPIVYDFLGCAEFAVWPERSEPETEAAS